MSLCVSLPSPLFPSRPISSLANTHVNMFTGCCERKLCFFHLSPPSSPLLILTLTRFLPLFFLLHRVWVKKRKKNPQKVISFSHYRWPFHWPSVIAIMWCGSWEPLWWGVRANTWASTNILSTLYLDTAVCRMLPATCWAEQPSRTPFCRSILGIRTCRAWDDDTRRFTPNLVVQYVRKQAGWRGKKQHRLCIRSPSRMCKWVAKAALGLCRDSVTNRLPVQSGMRSTERRRCQVQRGILWY